MGKIRAILFDWGGTLAGVRREDEAWENCTQAAIEALQDGGHRLPDTAALSLKEKFIAVRARSIADPLGKELSFERLVQSWLDDLTVGAVRGAVFEQAVHAFWNAWTQCLDLLDDADAVLGRLKKRRFKLGVVSNVVAPGKYCISQLKRLGLFEQLSTFTFSSEVGIRKPHEEIYHHALDQMKALFDGTPLQLDDVLFVGDSPLCDVAGPAQLGMQTALLTHPDIESPWPASDYGAINPTYRLTRLNELEPIL